MVVPIFGTWGMLGNNTPLVSIVTAVTPYQGFEAQHGLISSRFADTLLLIVPHGHMCNFLSVVEELIFKENIFDVPLL